jgi:hypothetical protein
MPDLEFHVPENIVTVIGPSGQEIHGIAAIRAHMEQLPAPERDKYRCILNTGHKAWWGQMNDDGAGLGTEIDR